MVIRCICGNECFLMPGGKPGYILKDNAWYDREANAVRCPKCKSTATPLEVLEATGSGQVKVKVVPGRTIQKKYVWT